MKKSNFGYTSPKKLEKAINSYFKGKSSPILDKNGNVIRDELDRPIYTVVQPYTITGLAHSLKLSSREELYGFKDPKMQALVNRAILKIEEYAEEKLFFKDSISGAKLFLEVNFNRWQIQPPKEEKGLSGEYSSWAV